MTNVVIAFLAALSAGAWVFSKVQRSTGGNTQNSIIVAAIAGGAAFLLSVTLLSLIPGN